MASDFFKIEVFSIDNYILDWFVTFEKRAPVHNRRYTIYTYSIKNNIYLIMFNNNVAINLFNDFNQFF